MVVHLKPVLDLKVKSEAALSLFSDNSLYNLLSEKLLR